MRACVLIGCLVVSPAFGDVYIDPTGDIATGNPNLDITQVEITDDGSDLTVILGVADLNADWGNYLMFLDIGDGGSGDNDNPWFRDIAGLAGMDLFVGTWLNGGSGVAAYQHDGGWGGSSFDVSLVNIDWAANTIEWRIADLVSTLSESGIYSLSMEVATTGQNNGDPAIDLIGNEGTQPGWNQGSTSTDRLVYDFSTIPAPAALGLLGLAGLRSRRRR